MPKNAPSNNGEGKLEDGQMCFPSSILHFPCSFLAILILSAPLLTSCRTAGPMPIGDFSPPGWRVCQGQAARTPGHDRPELAGDLLLATNVNGNFFVQFTKDPFPLATAESMGGQWQIEFGASEHSGRGRGEPPARFVWFQLPRAPLDEKIARNWHFENVTANSWRLENRRAGETLKGGFFP
jgi:hypothetical protein